MTKILKHRKIKDKQEKIPMNETIINTKKIHLFSPFCQSTHIFGGKTKITNNHNCVRMHYSRKS
jgi:hypothetical protein